MLSAAEVILGEVTRKEEKFMLSAAEVILGEVTRKEEKRCIELCRNIYAEHFVKFQISLTVPNYNGQ